MRPIRELAARRARLAFFASIPLLASVAVAGAATIVIQPSSQDAFILKNQPNRINGAKNTRIRVEASPPGTKIKRGLVQFPLGSIPAGSDVTEAVVELHTSLNASSASLTYGLFRITAPWQENAVKWNNQPPFVATPSATQVVGLGRDFKRFDVTADVQSAINLCANDHGWLIRDLSEIGSNLDTAFIASEEIHPADVPNRPRLTVTFAPPACTTDDDCDDTNLCTTQERCVAGVCVVDAVGCDDGNPCTTDVCDCGQGCLNEPICNDGFTCTSDTCDPVTLECTNTPSDTVCNTACGSGTCVADPDSTTIDPDTGCQIESTTPPGTPCSDGEPCTDPDQCNGTGTCVPGPKDCTSPVCGSSPLCDEECDNCVDDNENGLVDRSDPQCAPLPNGAGQGAGDPKFKGKPIVRCQKAIRTAGTQLANQLRTKLQRCTDGVFLCLQQRPGDAVCLQKARTRCLKQTAAVQGGPSLLEVRFDAKIAKACGPKKPGLLPQVSREDLCDEKGLGFKNDVPPCQTSQSSILGALSDVLLEEHRCRAVQIFAADVPRASELLAAGGVDPNTLPCLLDGAQGGNLGLGKATSVLKAVVSCQKNIATAGTRFVGQMLAAQQRCAETVSQCIQTKPGDAKCLTKAQNVCRKVTAKLFVGPKSREAKLKSTIARTCGTVTPGKLPRVAFGDMRSVLGLGYDTLSTSCTVLGIPGLTSLDDVSECLVRQHVCRADQIIESQNPRAQELLTIGGAVHR